MTGKGPIAWMIGRRFEVACERLRSNATSVRATTEHFRPPQAASEQFELVRVIPAILRCPALRVAERYAAMVNLAG